ncbi:hypothetical protein QTI66_31325 [Variovorax sp. J22R133]|uniref:hypothetical protein n=1 Tax=Variovorax brevis TaxID=3053503 RepID=UPI0025772435|nr:hypothetical protein [Variovorax sp. J22R133]MDM0116634.1 hypothetical protein [Variovorax sp. J22R133]
MHSSHSTFSMGSLSGDRSASRHAWAIVLIGLWLLCVAGVLAALVADGGHPSNGQPAALTMDNVQIASIALALRLG